MKIGQEVYISGEVKYGDNVYRVASNGIIQGIGETESLITVNNIDGDFNATVYVKNKYINKIN